MKMTGIGILGCGVISDIYLQNLSNVFENTYVAAVCDTNMVRAKEQAEKYGVAKVLTFDEMLADTEVELVLNITTPPVHFSLNKQGLVAGKHVYSEKPLALTYAQCKDLMNIAAEKRLHLGCAPDTFLGTTYQKAREIIDSGLLGNITSAYAFDVCHGHENWHPTPAFFYEEGAGPMYDRGPYNLSTLIMLMGPADEVAGMTSKALDERTILNGSKLGEKVPVKVPTHVNSLVHFKNGALCTISTSFDIWGTTLPFTEIHGTKGSMLLPIPIDFGGEIRVKLAGDKDFHLVEAPSNNNHDSRGLGLSDMVRSIQEGGDYRCNADFAAHAMEIMEAMHTSWTEHRFVRLESTCQRPAPMQRELAFGQVRR